MLPKTYNQDAQCRGQKHHGCWLRNRIGGHAWNVNPCRRSKRKSSARDLRRASYARDVEDECGRLINKWVVRAVAGDGAIGSRIHPSWSRRSDNQVIRRAAAKSTDLNASSHTRV